MPEHLRAFLLDILLRIGLHGQAGLVIPEEILDHDLHRIAGGLLVPPMVDLEFLRLEGCQQASSCRGRSETGRNLTI